VRLIRIRARRCKNDVWLLTNVLDNQRLPLSLAETMYRWRWQNEGCFRTYKHTLKKVKLVSRTLKLVHREAEGSWLALQLLIAQGVLAQQQRKGRAAETPSEAEADSEKQTEAKTKPVAPAPCSPRQILLAIRNEIKAPVPRRGQPRYEERIRKARVERRQRTSAKASRDWPRRKPHKPPKPPQLRVIDAKKKRLVAMLCDEAA
jgi:hypothetical protein